jgi:ABC-type lipoprotein release transport system permease subunit
MKRLEPARELHGSIAAMRTIWHDLRFAFRLLSGLAAGMTAALAGTHAIASMLIQVKPADPVTFLGAAFFLLLVSLLATWLPAWSATHIDPMAALRRE